MTETLTVSLILTAITGITILGYKHPPGYRRLAIPLITIISTTSCLLILFNCVAIWSAVGFLSEALSNQPGEPLKSQAYSIRMLLKSRQFITTAIAIWIPSIAYLIFLWHLPKIAPTSKSND